MRRKKINKKVLIITLAIVALIGAILAIVINRTTQLTNESYENCAVGDINGDGFINTKDALIIEKFMSDSIELFETQQKNADVNVDGKIDSEDTEIILKYAIGKIRKLPVTGDPDAQSPISGNDKLLRHTSEIADTTLKVVNTWSNGDGTFSYQLNVTIRNPQDSKLKGWKTTIKATDEMQKSKSWDCECEVDGDTIVIEGESIPAETVGVCGIIVTGIENLKFESVVTEK